MHWPFNDLILISLLALLITLLKQQEKHYDL